MRTLRLAAAAVGLAAASQAGAAVIIDDFYNYNEYGAYAFGTVYAYKKPYGEQLVATASSSNGTIKIPGTDRTAAPTISATNVTPATTQA